MRPKSRTARLNGALALDGIRRVQRARSRLFVSAVNTRRKATCAGARGVMIQARRLLGRRPQGDLDMTRSGRRGHRSRRTKSQTG